MELSHPNGQLGEPLVDPSDPYQVSIENQTQAKASKDSNPYDHIFKWNESDPWLGVPVDYGYVYMSLPVGKECSSTNYGFYWMYPSQKKNAPVLITFIGGPGMCVLSKAFGRFNPLDIDKQNHCLFKNNNAITNRYHLIYVESPIGSGFSYCSDKTKVKNYEVLADNAAETLEFIFKKHSILNLREREFFFNGETFCGLQLPKIISEVRDQCKIKVSGVILETPLFDPKQFNSYHHHSNFLNELKLWNNNCQKCTSLSCMCYGLCLKKSGLIKSRTWESCFFMPWVCSCSKNSWSIKEYTEDPFSNGQLKEKEKFLYNPLNLLQPTLAENVRCRVEIEYLITSKMFANLVGAKKVVPGVSDASSICIMDTSPKFSSNSLVNDLLDSGMSVLLITGEGDYLVPFEGIQQQVRDNWNIFEKEKFFHKSWVLHEDKWQYKRSKNFEWRRVYGSGNQIFVDNPKVHEEIVVGWLDRHRSQD